MRRKGNGGSAESGEQRGLPPPNEDYLSMSQSVSVSNILPSALSFTHYTPLIHLQVLQSDAGAFGNAEKRLLGDMGLYASLL